MRRSVIAGALLTAMATMVIACGDEEKAGGTEPQTLTISFNSTSTWPEPKAILTEAKKGFEASHPGVTIELQEEVAADDAYTTKLELRLSAGNDLPDIISIVPGLADGWAEAGYIQPLDAMLAEWPEWKAAFPDAVRDGAIQADGNIYLVPLAANDIGIWYNKDVFEGAGLPVPWEPKSWQDLTDAAATIKDKMPDAIPMHLYAGKASGAIDNVGKTFLPLLYGTDSTLYDHSTKKWQPAGKGFVDAMTFIRDSYEAGLTAEEADVLSPEVWSFIGPWMKDAQLGFVPDGNWMSFAWVEGGSYEWPEWGDRLGVAAFPTQNGEGAGKVSLGYKGAGFGIVKGSDSPNLAMEFIKFASSKESSVGYSQRTGQLAVRSDVLADPAYSDRPTVAEFSALLEYAQYLPGTAEEVKVWALLTDLIEKVAFGKITPQEAADSWNSEMSAAVGSSLWAG